MERIILRVQWCCESRAHKPSLGCLVKEVRPLRTLCSAERVLVRARLSNEVLVRIRLSDASALLGPDFQRSSLRARLSNGSASSGCGTQRFPGSQHFFESCTSWQTIGSKVLCDTASSRLPSARQYSTVAVVRMPLKACQARSTWRRSRCGTTIPGERLDAKRARGGQVADGE